MKVEDQLPISKDEKLFNKKVDYYKQRLPSILISPYDKKKWSKI